MKTSVLYKALEEIGTEFNNDVLYALGVSNLPFAISLVSLFGWRKHIHLPKPESII